MKKTLALFICALILSACFTSYAVNTNEIFARGNALEWTLSINIDKEMFPYFLQDIELFTEEIDDSPKDKYTDPEIESATSTLIDSISKLRLKGAFAPWTFNLSFGTDKANLASATMWADANTGGNGLTVDFLDYLFYLPQEKLRPILKEANALIGVDALSLINPYLTILRDEMNKLLEGKAAETGDFRVSEFGNFNWKVSLYLTNHDFAKVAEALLKKFEEDVALQSAINEIVNIAMFLDNSLPGENTVNTDIAKSIKEFIDKTKLEQNTKTADLSVYGREGMDTPCYVLDTSKVMPFDLFRLAILPDAKEGGLLFTAVDSSEIVKGAGTDEGIDWDWAHKRATQETVGDETPKEECHHMALTYSAPEKNKLDIALGMYSNGTPLVKINSEYNVEQAEPYKAKCKTTMAIPSVTAVSKPVFEINIALNETDKLPTLPDTISWPAVSLIDEDLDNKVDSSKVPDILVERFYEAYQGEVENIINAVNLLSGEE